MDNTYLNGETILLDVIMIGLKRNRAPSTPSSAMHEPSWRRWTSTGAAGAPWAGTRMAEQRLGGRLTASIGTALVCLPLLVSDGSADFLPETAPIAFEGPDDSRFNVSILNYFRPEFVDWWVPKSNPTLPGRYVFEGNRFRLSVGGRWRNLEVFAQLQQVTLTNIPANGTGPGGVYWANTNERTQAAAMLHYGWARLSGLGSGEHLSVTFGRQSYESGFEVVPTNPHLKQLMFERISERLIGNRNYSMIARAFDGVRTDFHTESLDVTTWGFIPVSGGFEIDGNKDIPQILTAGAVLGMAPPAPEWEGTSLQAFYYFYHDDRDLVVLDNRPLPERQAEQGQALTIHTIGGHAVQVFPLGPGTADVLAWGAAQLGQWQSLRHRAWVLAAEGGYQLPDVVGQPWLRVGINRGSGDSDPNDGYHETFYQLLPTARRRALTPFYNQMNNEDLFTQLWLTFSDAVNAQLSFHSVSVIRTADFAYAGGGPNSNSSFGYSGMPTNGFSEIAYLADVALHWDVTLNLGLGAYYGHAFGRSIVKADSINSSLNFGYLECYLMF